MARWTEEQFQAFCKKQKESDSSPSPIVQQVRTNIVIQKSTDEDGLNKLERRYLAHLRTLKYPWIGVMNLTLKLAHDVRLTIDFNLINENGELEAHDTKARTKKGKVLVEDDAKAKMQVAARQFPWIRFFIVTELNGGWDKKPIKP